MGWLRALALLGSLSACETTGIEVTVVMPPTGAAPDQVRLFIGLPNETEATIAPEDFLVGEERKGLVWVRDPQDRADVADVTPGEQVSFGYVAETDYELGAVIAVGYTRGVPSSAGSLFHLKTGVGLVRTFELQLHEAVDPREVANRKKPVQVELWGPNVGDETCVHLVDAHAGPDPHPSVFIVTRDDRDCDGYRDDDSARECAPDVHQASVPSPPSELACALSAEAFCMLGGPRCIDGAPRDEARCLPSDYCAPASVCAACEPLGASAETCIRDPLTHGNGANTAYRIECTVEMVREINTQTLELCGSASALNLQLPQRMMAAPKCSSATIADGASPAQDRLEKGMMRIDVDVSSDCAFKLGPSGEAPDRFVGPPDPLSGLVTIDVEGGRSLALPIKITFQIASATACAGTGTCKFEGAPGDNPTACLAAPRDR